VLQVAVPAPLRRVFDYAWPADQEPPAPGARVRVPFGRRQAVGVVLGSGPAGAIEPHRLKPVDAVLDPAEPAIPARLLDLLRWVASYYHHPVGEVLQAALPTHLRQGRPAHARRSTLVRVAGGQAGEPRRGPRQQALLELLAARSGGMETVALAGEFPDWRRVARPLLARGALVEEEIEPDRGQAAQAWSASPGPEPTPAQAQAIAAVHNALGEYRAILLHGITGSGKTEVYLAAICEVVRRGQQALVLVPEIALTPQLVSRLAARVQAPVAVLHSGLADSERLGAWLAARDGSVAVVLGTRSAVFTPLARPGLIVIDEEHDGSFKQQDGLRYHARDVAIVRARQEGVPIVLGSATPALETMHNAALGRYQLLSLPSRAGGAALPRIALVDMARTPAEEGLSMPLRDALGQRLAAGEQSLLFLNRRGFAPVLSCPECGWVASCQRCDAHLTLHRGAGRLRCHHCGAERPAPGHCPECAHERLLTIGAGTQRIEEVLQRRFPGARVVRIDRDSARRTDDLEAQLQSIASGEADILVGTQKLSKGRHFPLVTLVGVLDADSDLFSLDFRGPEFLLQQILQVAGRAGRGDRPGEVLVQTRFPQHPFFAPLLAHDYDGFARAALAERQGASLPPFTYLALLRAESPEAGAALQFLGSARKAGARLAAETGALLLEPVASPMERRAGRFRAQLLVQADARPALHRFLAPWLDAVAALPGARRVRWSIDVDPTDMH